MKFNPEKCTFDVQEGRFLSFMIYSKGIQANLDNVQAILDMAPPKSVWDIQFLTGKVGALNRFFSRLADKCLSFFKIPRKDNLFE